MNAPNHPSDSGHVFCRKLYSVSCCNVAALSGWAREGGYFLLHGGALNSNSELHTAIASLQPNTRHPNLVRCSVYSTLCLSCSKNGAPCKAVIERSGTKCCGVTASG